MCANLKEFLFLISNKTNKQYIRGMNKIDFEKNKSK